MGLMEKSEKSGVMQDRGEYKEIPAILLSVHHEENRYPPKGTTISNRAPFPGVPVSEMVIEVIFSISDI